MIGFDESIRRDLLERWSQPHRRHHTVVHLAEMLAAIDQLARLGEQFIREPVDLAAWFHDAVYEIGRADNEIASAQLARALVGEHPDIEEIDRLIMLTITHDVAATDGNGAVLCDADMSILGSSPARYRDYANAVREEYGVVPDNVFYPARAAFLRKTLDGGQIFWTAAGRGLWERAARINLAAELAQIAP